MKTTENRRERISHPMKRPIKLASGGYRRHVRIGGVMRMFEAPTAEAVMQLARMARQELDARRFEIVDGEERVESTLRDFLDANAEALDAEDRKQLRALAVGADWFMPVHCGFARITRIA